MNEEEQGSQVGDALKQAGKNMAKDMAKKAGRQLLKSIGQAIMSLVSSILSALAPILPYILIAAVLVIGIDWLVDAFTVEVSAQAVQTTLVENTTIENGKWKIDPKVYEEILRQLKEEGLTLNGFDEGENTVNADNVEEISYKDLKKLVDAEFASIHPKLSEDDELGTITFTRRAYDAESDDVGTLMTYMDYTEFHKKVDENNYDAVKNHFTLKEETSTVKTGEKEKTTKKYIAEFAKCTKIDDKITVTAEQYNYEMLVSNYITPLEFMVTNLQMSNSKDYVLAIADMVANNSKIEFCIQEQYSKVEETPVEEWNEIVIEYEYEEGKLESAEIVSQGPEKSVGTTKVTETITLLPYIKNLDTWMAKAEQVYNKKETNSGPDKVGETSLEDIETTNGNKYIRKYDRVKYTERKAYTITYSQGVTTTSNASLGPTDADVQAILTEVQATWPENMEEGRKELIEKAANLVNKGCKYNQDYREPGNSNPAYLDCSSYVAWAFTQTGHEDVPLYATTADFVNGENNFAAINDGELVPGDVGLNSNTTETGNANHIGIYIGKNSSGENIWLHCTSSGINGPQIRTGNGNFTVFYRYTNW